VGMTIGKMLNTNPRWKTCSKTLLRKVSKSSIGTGNHSELYSGSEYRIKPQRRVVVHASPCQIRKESHIPSYQLKSTQETWWTRQRTLEQKRRPHFHAKSDKLCGFIPSFCCSERWIRGYPLQILRSQQQPGPDFLQSLN